MSNDFTQLFATSENNQSEATGRRSLAGTAQLTNLSSTITNAILSMYSADVPEDIKPLLAASREDHGAMDELIAKSYDLSVVDTTFISELDEPTAEGMLKSQQSKRSRTKGKDMTLDNYRSMLTAAVAETLIRNATGKVKYAAGSRRASGAVIFTEDELKELAVDQGKLRAELRNVQSKKSICKKTADFSEDSERWQELLTAEAQLKDIRVADYTSVPRVDGTKVALQDVLAEVDIATLKAADSKELLARIQGLLK